jgi:hypothetical protein
MSRLLLLLLAAAFLAGLSACSTYQKRWTAAATTPGKKGVTGSYAGRWQSDHGGFGGKLWCIVDPGPGPAGKTYRAQFRATWHRFFVSEHEVLLHARATRGDGMKFTGKAEIKMWIGSGSYDCAGQIRGGVFAAHYDAHYDQGTFQMTRAGKN